MAPEGETKFSISPEEITATASTWKSQGTAVNGLNFEELSSVSGAMSKTMAAVRGCAGPAKAATNSIGTRLTSMGDGLHGFNARTTDSDSSSAKKFDDLTPR